MFLVVAKAEDECAVASDWPISSSADPSLLLRGLGGGGAVALARLEADIAPWPEELFEGVESPAAAEVGSQPPSLTYAGMPPRPPADALESVAWPHELFH